MFIIEGRGRLPGERRSSRSTSREQIPEHLARYLLSKNVCTKSDIASFNDRDRSVDESESSFAERDNSDFNDSLRGWSGVPYSGMPPWNKYLYIENDYRQQQNNTSAYTTPPQRRRNRGRY